MSIAELCIIAFSSGLAGFLLGVHFGWSASDEERRRDAENISQHRFTGNPMDLP